MQGLKTLRNLFAEQVFLRLDWHQRKRGAALFLSLENPERSPDLLPVPSGFELCFLTNPRKLLPAIAGR